ncbi:MAG: CehA/McbA family metallohydrolase [Anaerolineaceae bacterium]|nr:CehA/McbA family metallohydrolase [Anaerolineaceae bacterium]
MQKIFSHSLSKEDSRTYIEDYFDLPENMQSLQLSTTFEPLQSPGQAYDNRAKLTLFDPQDNFRGFCFVYSNKIYMISSSDASPGFMRGPFPAGKWRLVLAVIRVLGSSSTQLDVEIKASKTNLSIERIFDQPAAPDNRGPGWYRGDLHTHTNHSDGRWGVPELIDYARRFELDFVTLSDHNTVSGLEEFHSLGGNDLVTISGQELTTFFGHALALGKTQWFDWGIDCLRTEPLFADLAQKVIDSGALFIPTHPNNVGDPECGGCNWMYKDMKPGPARFFEIWNGPWGSTWSHNEDTLQQVYGWLNEGFKITMTAGTDHHGLNGSEEYIQQCGFNVAYAEAFDEQAILEGIRHGKLYLSQGPSLSLNVFSENGEKATIGDTLTNVSNIQVHASWDKTSSNDNVRLIINGHIHATRCTYKEEASWQINAEHIKWCLLEIRSESGVIRAISNPIYFE